MSSNTYDRLPIDPDRSAPRWAKWAFAAAVLVTIVWAIAALAVMPPMIRSAYHGGSPHFLTRLMQDRASWPVEHYLSKFFNLSLALLAIVLAGLLFPVMATSRWFEEKIIGRATPGALGAIRMYVCFVAAYAAWLDGDVAKLQQTAIERPTISLGIMNWAYALGLNRIVSNYSALLAFKSVTLTLLILAGLGLFTRFTLVLATISYVLLLGMSRAYFWFNHAGVVPQYMLAVLCFMRCADGFSLDRMIRIWRQQPVPDKDVETRYYGWCRWLAWAALCVPYALAGCSKMGNSGLMWWDGMNMMALLYRNALLPNARESGLYITELGWVPVWFYTFMGIMTIISEIGMLSCLFSKRIRHVLPIAIFGMHIGILYTMTIPFYDLMLLQAIFFDWRAIRLWLARRLEAAQGQWTLLYDGYCPLCRRTVGILAGADLLARMKFVSFRTTDFAEFNAANGTSITREHADREMFLVGRGKALAGYDAYREMSRFIPLMMPLFPLMWLPGVSHIGRAIYNWVARNRLSFFQCKEDCELAPGLMPTTAPESPSRRYYGVAWFVGLAPALLVLMWVNRLEFYPLSCFQMFTLNDDKYTGSSKVLYYRIYARNDSGEVTVAYPERMGYHTGRYWADVVGAFKFPVIRDRVTTWLQNVGRNYNDKVAPPGAPRVVQFELREMEWDFVRDAGKPERSNVARQIVIDVAQFGTVSN